MALQPRFRLGIILICALIILSSSACLAKVVYVKTTGSDSNDGLTWATAKKTIGAGITKSVSGDDIWVAAGTYVERIALKAGVGLYGGFAGAETARSQCNWNTNITILDGNAAGSVVTSPSGATSTTVINGLTIRNGNASSGGGGIHCISSSPTITNNTITGNTGLGIIYCSSSSSPTIANNTLTGNTGAGVYCSSSAPTITSNIIRGGSSSGIYCTSSSSPTITSNTIAANTGSAIYCTSSSPTITNNTIIGNTALSGGGIYCTSSSPTIVNNIVAYNSSGIYKYSGQGTPVLNNNCLYGNSGGNYSGLSAGTGDISLDPLFYDRANGDYHLTPGSPCVDKGTNVGASSVDHDGTPMPQDGDRDGIATCDIGAYELIADSATARRIAPDGTVVGLSGVVVTAASMQGPAVYVESTDRSSGMRVATNALLHEGQLVNAAGKIQTDALTGERYIQAVDSWPKPVGGSSTINPLSLQDRDLGGGDAGLQGGVWGRVLVRESGLDVWKWTEATGMNNIGLLVTVFGNISGAGDGVFYLDDGCALNDGSGPLGVKVLATGLTLPTSGFAKVTGISSCEKSSDGKIVRLLRVRKQDDIVSF